jgi:hypothetical protein
MKLFIIIIFSKKWIFKIRNIFKYSKLLAYHLSDMALLDIYIGAKLHLSDEIILKKLILIFCVSWHIPTFLIWS